MAHKGEMGTSMGSYPTVSKSKRKRMDRARKREEQRWASKAGPVTVYKLDPETGERVPVE